MSVTDGVTRHTCGNIQVPKLTVKRAYERLRKRSYRHTIRSAREIRQFLAALDGPQDLESALGPDVYLDGDHAHYVRGLRDMARAVTDSNRDGI